MRSYRDLALGWLLLLTLLHLWMIASGRWPLSADEAHYWEWSRRLDWSYYSKGPMVAYLIALSTRLGGHTEFWVRLPAVLLGTATAGIAYLLARRIVPGARAARQFQQLGMCEQRHAPDLGQVDVQEIALGPVRQRVRLAPARDRFDLGLRQRESGLKGVAAEALELRVVEVGVDEEALVLLLEHGAPAPRRFEDGGQPIAESNQAGGHGPLSSSGRCGIHGTARPLRSSSHPPA